MYSIDILPSFSATHRLLFSYIPKDHTAFAIAALAGFLLIIVLIRIFHTQPSTRLGLSIAEPNIATEQICVALATAFPEITSTRKDAGLWDCVNSYWSAQARAPTPTLVVRPRNVGELSKVVKILAAAVKASSHDEPVYFAIRSGGHSPVQAFASVDAGIVIDLGLFQAIELAEDRRTATIEVGARWGAVYRKLEKSGLAVAGGRASSVGVGGLTLGGGLSFFSPEVGFVCDAVESFEVVLADGSIVTASENSYPDLAVALRGGGNNFGIVTKIVARTFPSTKVWMGHTFHRPGAVERLIQAYYDYSKPETYDKKATCMFILCWAPYFPFYIPISCVSYTEPTPHPHALRRFTKESRFWNTLRVRTLPEASDVIEALSPANKQDLFHTITFENDLETMHCAHAAFKNSIPAIKKVPGMVWCVVFQPLVPSATLHHSSNAMGINTDKTLTVMHASITWSYAKDDPVVHKTAEEIVDRVEAFARKRGVYHPYKYANYCSAVQNPFPGYGPDRHKFLQEVSRRYDPDAIFQTGVPGGPKLWS